ncbi:hypothetical protein NDU88_003394 [Pleurodeles waltl]|uniref:Secreted protein n=1 Tax=Pleurodeles waltl TaxID=8319 RepID=A0AAV7UCN1_PLEWA|nr:hypothetical protein NDU88_003394 [Pleurodeles waltl]
MHARPQKYILLLCIYLIYSGERRSQGVMGITFSSSRGLCSATGGVVCLVQLSGARTLLPRRPESFHSGRCADISRASTTQDPPAAGFVTDEFYQASPLYVRGFCWLRSP